jgi:transposase, IS5 family
MKCLVLQGLYNLSDPALEDRLRDSLAFQQFIGIQDASGIPDETSICRFRNLLAERGVQTRIFDLTVELLHTAGFEIFQGCVQDATIIEAPRGRRKKPTEIKGTDTHDTAFSTRDPEAGFTKKNDKSYHGYKGHTETSQDGKFIVSTVVTNASVHDSQMRSELLTGLETSLH